MTTKLWVAAIAALLVFLAMTFLPRWCEVAKRLYPVEDLPARCLEEVSRTSLRVIEDVVVGYQNTPVNGDYRGWRVIIEDVLVG